MSKILQAQDQDASLTLSGNFYSMFEEIFFLRATWWAIIDGCHSYFSAFLFLETSFPLFMTELESQQLSLWINDLLFTNGDVGPDDNDVDDDDDGGDNSCSSLKDHS